MPNHYLDAPDDSLLTTNEMVNRDDLSSIYRQAKHEELGPWLTEAQRQQVLKDKRDAEVIALRPSFALVGFLVALPVVMSIIMFHVVPIVIAAVTKDSNLAMITAAGGIFVLTAYIFLSIGSLKRAGAAFSQHGLKASPVIITLLLCLVLAMQPLAFLADQSVSENWAYTASLVALPALNIVLAGILMFMWTSPRVVGVLKIATQFMLVAVCAGAYFVFR